MGRHKAQEGLVTMLAWSPYTKSSPAALAQCSCGQHLFLKHLPEVVLWTTRSIYCALLATEAMWGTCLISGPSSTARILTFFRVQDIKCG
jgi:hypothetical protein